MKVSVSNRRTARNPQFLAGDLALDFLNTRMSVRGKVLDLFQTDADVIAWLERAGFFVSKGDAHLASQSLLHGARELRENIRVLVEKRKTGRRGDPSVLNKFLVHAKSHPKLEWKKPQLLTVERVWEQDGPESFLAPIAEAAAVLLASADFTLVKRCEGEGCLLWFSDQTRSHHRRWCSTKICGNRNKVSAFRKRHLARTSSTT